MAVLAWTFVIFFARMTDVGLGTIRVQYIVRGKKVAAALIGFVEVLIFILVVSRVIRDIQHWPYVLAYASGFAAGTLLGVHLAERLAQRVLQATVISHGPSAPIEAAIREANFALTSYEGVGRDGPVKVIEVVCAAEQLPRLVQAVMDADGRAFVYTQELAGVRGGYVNGLKSKK